MLPRKDVRPEARVKARMHQLESAVASDDYLWKHPDQLRKRQQKGKIYHESSSDSEDETSDFAELLRNLTLGAGGKNSSKDDALRQSFKMLDCDGDGFITLSDLRQALQGFDEDDDDQEEEEEKLTDDDLLDMLLAADPKGNGKISFDSFARIVEPKQDKERNRKRTTQKS